MGALINFEVKKLPRVKLLGKELRYGMDALMRGDNPLPGFWDKCFAEDAFAPLEAQGAQVYDPSYVGVMTDWDRGDGDFSYIVGMLMREDTLAPEGYYSKLLEPAEIAVGYIQGKDTQDVCGNAHELTEQALKEKGYRCDGMAWSAEVYNCPRFTEADADGNIVLDYYIPLSE